MFARLTLLSLLCLPLSAVHAQLTTLTIELKDFAQAQARQVRLSEIAVLKADDASSLGRMVVATLAHVNQPLRIEAAQLLKIMVRQQPALRGKIQLIGATAVSVILPGEILPGAAVVDAAKTLLHKELARHTAQYVLRDLRVLRADVQVPKGALSLRAYLNAPFGTWTPAAQITVSVAVFVNDKRVDTIPVAASIDMQLPVYRLTRAVVSGEVLKQTDYELAQQPLADARQTASLVPPEAVIAGLRARRNLAAQAVLHRHDIEAVPPVTRHQTLAAELKTGGIVIEKNVVAQSDGYLGQKIKVADAQSVSVYVAKVIAPGRVEVE